MKQFESKLRQSREQISSYQLKMQLEWQKHYDQIRVRSCSRQVRIRTTPSPERPIKLKFLQSPLTLYTTSSKATVILPLQNEKQYTLPETRQGCKAIELSQQLGIVLGGYSYKESLDINFIDIQNGQWLTKQQFQQWEQLKQKMKENDIRFGQHFSLNYDIDGQSLYIFGGERVCGMRRQSNLLIKIQDYQIQQWNINCINPRRNHTGSLIDNQLIIIGGYDNMNTKPNYYGDMISINLQTMRSTILNKQLFKNGLAYHNQVVVQKKNQFFADENNGIYIFGGKDQDEIYNEDLLFLDQQYQLTSIQFKGFKPKNRRSCSMNYDENSQSIIIFGGTNDIEIFDDLYTFNILQKTWCKIQLNGYLNFSPRYEHCSLYQNEKLLIFGGLNEQGYILFNPIQINLKLKRTKLNQ